MISRCSIFKSLSTAHRSASSAAEHASSACVWRTQIKELCVHNSANSCLPHKIFSCCFRSLMSVNYMWWVCFYKAFFVLLFWGHESAEDPLYRRGSHADWFARGRAETLSICVSFFVRTRTCTEQNQILITPYCKKQHRKIKMHKHEFKLKKKKLSFNT